MKYNPTITVPAPIKSNTVLGWLEDTAANPVVKVMIKGAYSK